MTDKITELHALHVLDVLELTQELVDNWQALDNLKFEAAIFNYQIDRIADALYRLDRLEEVTEVAA